MWFLEFFYSLWVELFRFSKKFKETADLVKRYIPYLNLRWPCLVIWLTKMKELLGYVLKYTFLAAPFLGYSYELQLLSSHIAVPSLDYCLLLSQILYGKNLQKKSWFSCIRIGIPRGGRSSSYEYHLHPTSFNLGSSLISLRPDCMDFGPWFLAVIWKEDFLGFSFSKFCYSCQSTSSWKR